MKLLTLLIPLLIVGCSTVKTVNTDVSPTLRSTGVGNSIVQAKHDAFANAIEFKMGSLVLSERETNNLVLTKDEILTYSSGYIDRYQMIHQTVSNNKVIVVVDVWVSDSKIKNRILGSGTTIGKINGDKHKTQYDTYLKNRSSGDKLLENVLVDYPSKAFILNYGTHQLRLDSNRNALLTIPYSIKWNYNYIESLQESLSVVQDGSNGFMLESPGYVTIMMKKPDDYILGKRNIYRFNDLVRIKKISQQLTGDNVPAINVKLIDNSNKVMYDKCYYPNPVSGRLPPFLEANDNSKYILIHGNQTDKDRIVVNIKFKSELYGNLGNLQHIVMAIVKVKNCK